MEYDLPELAEGDYAIVISDSHGSNNYVDFAYDVAKKIESEDGVSVKAAFHLGDMGNFHLTDMKSNRKHFFRKFQEYDTFVVKGNHDYEWLLKRNMKKIKKKYEKKFGKPYPRELKLIDDEVTEYHGLKIIGMGLWHLQQTDEFTYYNEKLEEMLQEHPNAILMSHFGEKGLERKTIKNWVKKQLGKGHIELMQKYDHVNIHGHVHPHPKKDKKWQSTIQHLLMYLGIKTMNYEKEKKVVKLIDPQKKRFHNMARIVGIMPLNPEQYKKH